MYNAKLEISQQAVMINDANQCLILNHHGKWMLPGGRLQEDEEWQKGLQREIEEETGINGSICLRLVNMNFGTMP